MPLSVMTRESPFINVLERIRHTKGHQALVHKRTSLKRPNSDYTWCHFPLEKNRSGHLEKKTWLHGWYSFQKIKRRWPTGKKSTSRLKYVLFRTSMPWCDMCSTRVNCPRVKLKGSVLTINSIFKNKTY